MYQNFSNFLHHLSSTFHNLTHAPTYSNAQENFYLKTALYQKKYEFGNKESNTFLSIFIRDDKYVNFVGFEVSLLESENRNYSYCCSFSSARSISTIFTMIHQRTLNRLDNEIYCLIPSKSVPILLDESYFLTLSVVKVPRTLFLNISAYPEFSISDTQQNHSIITVVPTFAISSLSAHDRRYFNVSMSTMVCNRTTA